MDWQSRAFPSGARKPLNESDVFEKVLGVFAELAPKSMSMRSSRTYGCAISSIWTPWTFLNFLIGIDEQLGIDIPEAEYPRLAALDSIYTNLRKKLSAA